MLIVQETYHGHYPVGIVAYDSVHTFPISKEEENVENYKIENNSKNQNRYF